MQTQPTIQGTFSEEKAKAILFALNKLTKVGVEKIILDFKVGDVNTLSINAINSINTVQARIKFDGALLDGFKLEKDFKYGISKLNDFVGIVDIFKSGFELKMSPDIASLSSDENFLDYYGADTTKIKQGDDGELELDVLASVQCDESFKEFLSAVGKLEHKHIVFRGNSIGKFITMSVADKDVRGNSFTKKIHVQETTDFKVSINKDYFSSVLMSNTTLNIYKPVIQLKKREPLYNTEYYIVSLI